MKKEPALDAQLTSYDQVLYPNYAFKQTHPGRLATIATLLGMKPAPIECCRVLELGCNGGGNLVPMAFGLPKSEFVGIDLAARPIAKGQAMIEALGLKNISLHHLDVMAVSDDFGQFDYIIAHGLYSWVPPVVQDKILDICQRNLAPQGVAYISYNAYPGSHLRHIIREMMLFHTRDILDPQQQVKQARALIKWLADAQTTSNVHQMLLVEQRDHLMKLSDASLYHDDLAEINAPIYFHQFIEHAARHGLQFLNEADYYEIQAEDFPSEVVDQLRQLAVQDILGKEQYMDFLKGRSFRETLLCRHQVPLNREPRPEIVRDFYVASQARPVSSQPEIESHRAEKFQEPRGGEMTTDYPLAKAAMLHLSEIYPQSIHFDGLLTNARSRVGLDSSQSAVDADQEAHSLANILLRTYGSGVIELGVHAPNLVLHASERPVVSPLARWQARNGRLVTTLRHQVLQVDDLMRHLLLLLDGTRDRAALWKELAALVEADAELFPPGEEVSDRKRFLEMLPEELEKQLDKIARYGLLLA